MYKARFWSSSRVALVTHFIVPKQEITFAMKLDHVQGKILEFIKSGLLQVLAISDLALQFSLHRVLVGQSFHISSTCLLGILHNSSVVFCREFLLHLCLCHVLSEIRLHFHHETNHTSTLFL